MNKRISLFGLMLAFFAVSVIAQVTTDPSLPTADAPVTIYLDAAGTGLQGYTGNVYAHTGVTIGTNKWQHVIGSWGNNQTQPQLIRTGTDLYKLEITPSIRAFYNCTAAEDITEMCFVFRAAEGSPQTSPDIFIAVFEPSLNILLVSPAQSPYFVEPGENIAVVAEASFAQNVSLFVDNVLIVNQPGNSINQTITASANPDTKHWIKVVAYDGTGEMADSTYYYVRGDSYVEDLPAGVRDGINYQDAATATLVIHAPYKSSIYVVGDFNNWEVGPEFKLKRNKTDYNNIETRYWVTLNNLTPGTEYAFQYLIDEELRLADAYADKILDKWNDPYIPNTTYPNLKPYPGYVTEGIVSVLQTNQTPYTWQVTNFDAPENTDLVVYELLVRDFFAAQNYQTLTDTISYLKRLGVNAIELMPINEFEGNLSWGYNPSFYFAPDKYYGTKNALKTFVDACHANGIAVIMDIALNHSYGQNVMAQQYWDSQNNRPAANNLWFNQVCPHEPYCWGNDFNHQSIYTQQLVDRITEYWLTEYNMDGFRFDYTKGFTNSGSGGYYLDRINTIKRMADAIWDVKPGAYVILEHWCDNPEEKILADYGCMLWGNSNYNYNEATMGWHNSGGSDFSWISYKKRGWNDPHLVGYMESHDEERLMYKNVTWGNFSGDYNVKDTTIALERQAAAAAFFYTIPGPKMIWQFGERGFDYSINWPSGTENDRLTAKPPRWDYMDDYRRRYLYNVNAALIDLKLNHDVFRTTDFSLDLYNSTKSIVLNHSSMKAVVVGNFDVISKTHAPAWPSTGTWYEFFTQTTLDVTANNQAVALNPGEYRLYTSVYIPKPQYLNTDIHENSTESRKTNLVDIYPNPTTGEFTLLFNSTVNQKITIEVYDMIGNKIMETSRDASSIIPGGSNHHFTYTLNPGMYLVRTTTGEIQDVDKLIVE